jgi:death-on-curing protein
VDGNKRTGFLAAYTFLYINGWELAASEVEAAVVTLTLAAGNMAEAEFSEWLKKESNPLPTL